MLDTDPCPRDICSTPDSLKTPPNIPAGMMGKRSLFGWRLDVTKLVERLRALESEDARSQKKSQSKPDDGRGEDLARLPPDEVVYSLAQSAGIRPYVCIRGDIVWLCRNYISPRGPVCPRGLTRIPDEARIQKFSQSAGLGKPSWLLKA